MKEVHHMSKNKKMRTRKPKYDVISFNKRIDLINLVLKKKWTRTKACKKLNIKLTTGCLIIRTYQKYRRIMQKVSSQKPSINEIRIVMKERKEKSKTRKQRYEERKKRQQAKNTQESKKKNQQRGKENQEGFQIPEVKVQEDRQVENIPIPSETIYRSLNEQINQTMMPFFFEYAYPVPLTPYLPYFWSYPNTDNLYL